MQYHATIVTQHRKPNLKETEMKTETIMTDFSGRAAKIIEEVRNKTRSDKIDTKVLFVILQDALTEYYTLLNGYFDEEYYIAVSSARSSAYDAGYEDGYEDGYEGGYFESHSEEWTYPIEPNLT